MPIYSFATKTSKKSPSPNMKKIIFLLLILGLSAAVGEGLYYLKDGFTARRIHSLNLQGSDDFTPEVRAALSQTYHYIGRGRQCFAFASADDQYVLKFPRTDIYKTPLWVRSLPFLKEYRARLEKDHLERQQFILTSFQISFEELKEQTALLALHLGQSPSKEKLSVVDALGCKHSLPLGKTSFVLQYKRPILMQAFLAAIKKGHREEAKTILDSLVDVIADRARKGILNRDRSFLRNYGFDGKKAYQIDVGSFFRKEEMSPQQIYEKSLGDSIDPIQEWLAQTDEEMLHYLNSKLQIISFSR